jgi:arylsulfatase A-like enzyme
MKKYLSLIICSLTFNLFAQAKNNTNHPNLLIIHTDEHNFRTLGCYRNILSAEQAYVWGKGIKVETPNIDFLAENGALFSNFYAASPVCSPSRASFVTGLYPQHTGVPVNDKPLKSELVTFAQIFSKKGYNTGYLGKWHLDGDGRPQWQPARNFGFTDNKYMFNRGHWKMMSDTPEGPKVASVNKQGIPDYGVEGADEKSFTTDFLTDKAIKFLEKNNPLVTGKPFCCMLSLPDPHGPDLVRAPYDTMYLGFQFQAPVSYNKKTGQYPKWAAKAEECSLDLSLYFGMVKCIDDNVGKLIKYLKEKGLLNNTIVVFTSDHGDLLGEHHRHNKGVPYDASAKIPFIIYYPQKIKPGQLVSNPVNTTDFAPSILALASLSYPASMHGHDFSSVITGKKKINLPPVTYTRMPYANNNGWVAVTDGRFKLVVSSNDIPWLFDNMNDPFELKNATENPENKLKLKNLALSIAEYHQKYGDPILDNPKIAGELESLTK